MFSVPRRTLALAGLVAGFLLLTAPASFAQQVFGSIYGTVTDASAGAVPNAKVSITDQNKGTRFDVFTNTDGNFSRDRLIPGLYAITVEVSGFSKQVAKDVQVNIDASSRVDFALKVGQVSEQIEVTAAAPLLQADRADISTNFTNKQLVDLPRLDRNYQSFLLLTPGTSRLGWNHASSENPQGSIQIQVNGQHFGSTGYILDGTDNQDPILGIIIVNPAIDSVTETKISGQNYDAEFSYVGAGILNTSTKSGANQIHGSVFEYLRDNTPGFTTFARDPFNGAESAAAGGVPPVKWNQFGGSIGGAVIKNKLFFFGDAQLTRRRTGSSVKTSVPTAAARNGDFSGYLPIGRDTIFDPLTGNQATGVGRTAFTNNIIPANRISSQAKALIALLPLPNSIDTGLAKAEQGINNNFTAVGSEQFDSNQWDTRWDYFINEKSQLFGRYSEATFQKFAPGAFGTAVGGPALNNVNFSGNSDVGNRSIAIGYTRTLNTTTVADVRFGYVRYRVNVLPGGLGSSPAKDAGVPGLNLDSYFTSGLPRFNANGDGGFDIGYSLGTNQCNCPLAQREQQYQFVGNVTKVVGNHSIKIGADLRRALNLRVPSDSHRAGELTFSNGYTGSVASAGASVQQGLGVASFLLGGVTGFQRYVSSATDASESQKRLFWYIQDTWRLTPKLQLNYGMRWEMVFPEKVNAPGNGGQLDLRTGLINVFGVGNVSDHGIQEMNYKNFAPRVGITYQLTPKTVIRAGYGWAYSVGVFGTLFGHNVTQNLPVLANQSLNAPNGFSNVFTLAQGPPSPAFPKADSNGTFKLPDGISGKARPLDVVMPRVMSYNVTVQQQLAKDLSVQVAYVGNSGRHVFNGDGPNFNVNQAAFIVGNSDANLARPFYSRYGWTQGIDFYCNCATSKYNSLQVQFEKRFQGGLNLTGNYTNQRATDDSGDSFTFLYNRPLGRGSKDWFPHNQFVIAPTFDVPFGKGRKYGNNMNRALDYALGGWTVSAITTYYSGRPFTPGLGNVPTGSIRPNQGPGDRPDVGSGDPYSGAVGGRDGFFVGGLGKAFLLPANNVFGNYPRNGLFGPQFINVDMSLAKNFAVTEKYKFSLRGESFNVANHTNLGDPNSDLSSGSVGKITSIAPSYQMRRMQFGFRLDF